MNPPTTRDRSLIPAFLRQLTTLLTCSHKDDPDAKQIIAVTGSFTSGDLWILVLTQNPFGTNDVSGFGVKEITKSNGTFIKAVVKG